MSQEESDLAEDGACVAELPDPTHINPQVTLPHGLEPSHVLSAMSDFVNFLTFINQQLRTKQIERLETMLMPANFSSLVSEFMVSTIAKYCPTLVKNQYHNGHPDLIPAGLFAGDAVQYANEGIEIKASRRTSGWQGHNPEDAWLLVFVFDSNTAADASKSVAPKPFRFRRVVGARVDKADWNFAGRSDTSRRTITAGINRSGYAKLMSNWLYRGD